MDFQGLVDRVQTLLIQNANSFYDPSLVEGANLIRSDLGVLG
jgi:hypothetical protein